MSAEVLVRLNAERKLEAREISDLLNLAQSSAYRYMCDTELRHGQLRSLVHHANNRDAAEALVRSITDGTEFAIMRVAASADFDRDGDVDCDDALKGAIRCNRAVGELLELIHHSMNRPPVGEINPTDAEDLSCGISELLGWLAAVQKIIGDAADRHARRRKANPFSHRGAQAQRSDVRMNGFRRPEAVA